MYDKYKKLQEALKAIIIRAKDNTENPKVIVEITGEMKIKKVEIVDETMLSPHHKTQLEHAIQIAFEKGQAKAQEVATEKTKEILGFDPSQMANMMGSWSGGMPNIPGLN